MVSSEGLPLPLNGVPLEVKPATPITVTLRGAIATELRRVSHNLDVEPNVIVKELIIEGLKKKYGVTVK